MIQAVILDDRPEFSNTVILIRPITSVFSQKKKKKKTHCGEYIKQCSKKD